MKSDGELVHEFICIFCVNKAFIYSYGHGVWPREITQWTCFVVWWSSLSLEGVTSLMTNRNVSIGEFTYWNQFCFDQFTHILMMIIIIIIKSELTIPADRCVSNQYGQISPLWWVSDPWRKTSQYHIPRVPI